MHVTELSFDDQLDLACDMLYQSHRESAEGSQYNFLIEQGFDDDLAIIAVEEFNS